MNLVRMRILLCGRIMNLVRMRSLCCILQASRDAEFTLYFIGPKSQAILNRPASVARYKNIKLSIYSRKSLASRMATQPITDPTHLGIFSYLFISPAVHEITINSSSCTASLVVLGSRKAWLPSASTVVE